MGTDNILKIKSSDGDATTTRLTTHDSPTQNLLLATLPAMDFTSLAAHLEQVEMPLGKLIYEPGERLQHIYFPTTAIVSLHYILESGASIETAGVGREGVVGVSVFMGGDSTPGSAVVRTAGHAYRLESRVFMQHFNRSDAIQRLMLRYIKTLMTKISLLAVCNRHHSVDQQLCRWLLLTLDRLPTNELIMTQEQVANMLGVRREGITEAAGKLQHHGIIRYRRGHIEVLDRRGLEARTCECYAQIKTEIDHLLSVAPSRPEAPYMVFETTSPKTSNVASSAGRSILTRHRVKYASG